MLVPVNVSLRLTVTSRLEEAVKVPKFSASLVKKVFAAARLVSLNTCGAPPPTVTVSFASVSPLPDACGAIRPSTRSPVRPLASMSKDADML